MAENIRVLMAKVGLDGHDRGVRVVSRCLRDAGMDVVYTGLHRTPEEVVDAAVQEDVDVLGVSLLSGAHMTAFPRIMKRLKERGVSDMILLGGGVIPDEDGTAPSFNACARCAATPTRRRPSTARSGTPPASTRTRSCRSRTSSRSAR